MGRSTHHEWHEIDSNYSRGLAQWIINVLWWTRCLLAMDFVTHAVVTTWDPILIISQIVSLQALYYIILSLLLWITLSLSGMPMTLDALFQTTTLQTDNVFGWTLGLVVMVNAVATIPVVVVIVQRARQVLDFVLTLHGIHVFGCWIHSHRFPSTLAWWLVQLVAVIVMTLGGEWACMRYEMKPILLSNDMKNSSKKEIDMDISLETIEEETDIDDPSSSRTQKKGKRKQSDAEKDHQREDEHQEGPLTAAVEKARQVFLDKSQGWISSSSKNAKDYEIIPMNSVTNR
ncbi:integral membrane protein S linking to the trans Golgi network-domain-containing protein [Halteromyces radiatus]|uniref:integral membrane protein S linking to the trans Golgi network-domain-containing protein n=1 Tax=Halteromyces radiatus TaxID=101107 RepID=UPI00221FB3E6|nr:integral membrane protein S linking to the trans Golgi network-domain-containing protein [Halteromyces radiatus]KAI8079815.1 integral membrane protein S linking to the trans Golgi network-domain-containing protein [Halteromyces radiatus]